MTSVLEDAIVLAGILASCQEQAQGLDPAVASELRWAHEQAVGTAARVANGGGCHNLVFAIDQAIKLFSARSDAFPLSFREDIGRAHRLAVSMSEQVDRSRG